MNNIIESLYQRKSVRVFLDKEISLTDKELLLNCAIQAPTAGNLCLYTILDITDQAIKNELAILCDNQPFIAKAPLVLIFLADYQKYYELYKMTIEKEVEKPKLGDLMLACADAIIAAQNTVVAAESLGIGSCYIGDIIERHDEVTSLLKLPDYTFPACMLVYGYPTLQQEEREKPRRFQARDLVYENEYKLKTAAQYEQMYKGQNERYDYKDVAKKVYGLKYDVDFRREMNNSTEKYLKKWR